MRMCYLSISHTNVFSVTVPPGRLQEGSGALIKAAFAGQECGSLHPGVTGAGCLDRRSLCSDGQQGTQIPGSCGPSGIGPFPPPLLQIL